MGRPRIRGLTVGFLAVYVSLGQDIEPRIAPGVPFKYLSVGVNAVKAL